MISPEDLEGVTWLEPWEPLEAERGVALDRELEREVCPTHALAGSTHKAVAARGDCDDALFIVDGTRLAIVHLTWTEETDPLWPSVTFVADLPTFVRQHMEPDHEEFVA